MCCHNLFCMRVYCSIWACFQATHNFFPIRSVYCWKSIILIALIILMANIVCVLVTFTYEKICWPSVRWIVDYVDDLCLTLSRQQISIMVLSGPTSIVTLIQCRFNVGTAVPTLSRHWINVKRTVGECVVFSGDMVVGYLPMGEALSAVCPLTTDSDEEGTPASMAEPGGEQEDALCTSGGGVVRQLVRLLLDWWRRYLHWCDVLYVRCWWRL